MKTTKKGLLDLARDLGAEAEIDGERFNRTGRDKGSARERIEEQYLEVPGTNTGPTALERLSDAEKKLSAMMTKLSAAHGTIEELQAALAREPHSARIDELGKAIAKANAAASYALEQAAAAIARPIPRAVATVQERQSEPWRFKVERDPLDNLEAIVATSASGKMWRFEFRRSHGEILGFTATPLTQ